MSNARDRERSQRLQIDTLIVASLASATAALVTSFVWRPGAIVGAALTPVIVAIVSELLQRPAQRITQVRAVRRVPEPSAAVHEIRAARLREREKAAVGPPEPVRDRLADPLPPPLVEPPAAAVTTAPLRVYRKPRPNIRLALVTAAAAFAIATAALTLPELIGGGSVTGDGRTTLFSPGGGTGDRDRPGDQRGGERYPDRDRGAGELREPDADRAGGRSPEASQRRREPSGGDPTRPEPAREEVPETPSAPDVPPTP